MFNSIEVSEADSPEKCFNFISQNAPIGTKNLIRAMKTGLNAEKAKQYLKETLAADTPPILVTAFEKSINYIDNELKQGGFALF